MFGDRPLREVVPLFDIQAEEAGEGDKMTKAEFKKLSVVLGKKYKKVELTDDNMTFISIEPFETADVGFFLFFDGVTGWNRCMHSDSIKSTGKEFPTLGTTAKAMIIALEGAIRKYVAEEQKLYDECWEALVEWEGCTKESAQERWTTKEIFSDAWVKELGIRK